MTRPWIERWQPDDDEFWEREGKAVARRNITFSIFAEFLAFSVWVLWSITAVSLKKAGFSFSTAQLFTLVALPTLVGSTLRIPYTFAVARFGGRNWTVVSALLLLVPACLLAVMVSHPGTPYWAFLLAAATAGFGGGNFASSMANISFFYPDKRKGLALGLNAAGGNIGVAVAQLVVPFAVTSAAIAVLGGSQGGRGKGGAPLFLQNAGLIWIPLILAAAACAWLFMDNLKVSQAPFREQVQVVRRRPTWLMSCLYVGTFGSFLGYSSGLPLLIKTQFPTVTLSVAFVGPLLGSLSRPVGGWLADRFGGARVTIASFLAMMAGVTGVIFCLAHRGAPHAFGWFFASFILLFVVTGIANGSTFQMIPKAFQDHHLREAGGVGGEPARRAAIGVARMETAAALGFISAIGAYGGWLIPQAFGVSSSLIGSPAGALYLMVVFYMACLFLTWRYAPRPGSPVEPSPGLPVADLEGVP